METGRAVWGKDLGTRLTKSDARVVKGAWLRGQDGRQKPCLRFDDRGGAVYLIGTSPLFFVDPWEKTWGEAKWEVPISPKDWLRAPEIEPDRSGEAREELLMAMGGERGLSLPEKIEIRSIQGEKPKPIVELVKIEIPAREEGSRYHYFRPRMEAAAGARVKFRYQDIEVSAEDPNVQVEGSTGNEILHIERDLEGEESLL
ncbi:MAG: hypothetical protein AAF191_15865 [Verrucomicrobiota bacterium]